MVAYNWGGNLKAPLPFDGQVWADQDLHVWRWNDANQAWNRSPHIELQKAYSRAHSILGFTAGDDFLNTSSARKAGRIGHVWDDAYDLAFVEVRDSDGALYGRRAHMSLADMLAWVGTIVPLAGGVYDRNIVLTVYEPVDTMLGMPKWHVWNNLYASFRGRECYFGNSGYGRPGMPGRAGYSPNFASYHGVNLEYLLLMHFYGKVPPSSEPRVCWSTRSRHGLYHHPNDSTARIMCTDGAKWVWNDSTNTWSSATVPEEYLQDGAAGANPVLVWRTPGSPVLNVEDISHAVRGLRGVLGDSSTVTGREGLVVRAMRSSANNNLKAFVVKPYGVTEASWNMTTANEDLLALPTYEGCASGGVGVFNLTRNGLVEERGDRGIRYNVASMYGRLFTGYGSPWQLTHDSPVIPEVVRFYLRDRVTGVRRPTSQQHLYLERRRSCVPVAIMFRHG